MPRPLWSGSLSFGLVNVPVSVVTASRDLDLHFHQIHAADGEPIEVQRWCSEEEVEVPYDEIARACELEDGRQVIVSDQELDAVAPQRTRTIEIERFVDLDEIDPLYFSHPYFLVPSDDDASLRAYRLLAEVMSRTQRAALGRFVMRTKEYLAVVRERDGALSIETMRFATEVRPTDEIEAAAEQDLKPPAEQVDAAVAVIEELSVDWEPDRYEDHYRARLQKVINRKRKGETIKVVDPDGQPKPAPDLLAALETTLQQLRSGSSKPTRSTAKSSAKSTPKRAAKSTPTSAKPKRARS